MEQQDLSTHQSYRILLEKVKEECGWDEDGLINFIECLAGKGADKEDLVQEFHCRLIFDPQMSKAKDAKSVRAYLTTSFNHDKARWALANKKRSEPLHPEVADPDPKSDPVLALMEAEALQQLNLLIAAIESDVDRAIIQGLLAEKKTKVIAADLGMTDVAVRVRKTRLKQQLREQMKAESAKLDKALSNN